MNLPIALVRNSISHLLTIPKMIARRGLNDRKAIRVADAAFSYCNMILARGAASVITVTSMKNVKNAKHNGHQNNVQAHDAMSAATLLRKN